MITIRILLGDLESRILLVLKSMPASDELVRVTLRMWKKTGNGALMQMKSIKSNNAENRVKEFNTRSR